MWHGMSTDAPSSTGPQAPTLELQQASMLWGRLRMLVPLTCAAQWGISTGKQGTVTEGTTTEVASNDEKLPILRVATRLEGAWVGLCCSSREAMAKSDEKRKMIPARSDEIRLASTRSGDFTELRRRPG
ncbi:hypothetical protein L484_026749 [Morus notabilis]|uniref:Uncharacterized protein n=1 Tax=Morus notabilis TaxID=981085 RepID=W9SCX6_9ROSA|nr:hypothetical protein L484_026749 [Morus notabilis]